MAGRRDRKAPVFRRSAVCRRRPSGACRRPFPNRTRHAPVLVAVGDVDLVGRGGIDRDVGRRTETVGGVAVGARHGLADLHDELAVPRELQDLPVGAVVAGDPDEPVGVHGCRARSCGQS